MKHIQALLLTNLLFFSLSAQVFDVDTIQYRGDDSKHINLVILADGYTSTQQAKFITDATYISDYLFTQAPWTSYRNYFNIYAVKVISNQSGAKHPNTASDCSGSGVPVSNPDTYFGCTFDGYGIHRLIIPGSTSKIVSVLAANTPGYDQAIVLSNSPYYGGSGGTFACFTTHTASAEINAHELGHSFAGLADEYYAGDIYNAEKPNMTQQTNPSLVKWKNWVGTNAVGIYQYCCGGQSASWYKPHKNCKMEALDQPYCSVCKEAIVEKIHSLTKAVQAYTPTDLDITSGDRYLDFKLTELILPVPNTLQRTWTLDGTVTARNTDSTRIDQQLLPEGAHTLSVTVVDTTSYVRKDNHASIHFNTVSWTINKHNSGISISSISNKISFSMYPNPVADLLTIELESEKPGKLDISIVSPDGKILKQLKNEQFSNGSYRNTISIESLPAGTYMLMLQSGSFAHSQGFIKM